MSEIEAILNKLIDDEYIDVTDKLWGDRTGMHQDEIVRELIFNGRFANEKLETTASDICHGVIGSALSDLSKMVDELTTIVENVLKQYRLDEVEKKGMQNSVANEILKDLYASGHLK